MNSAVSGKNKIFKGGFIFCLSMVMFLVASSQTLSFAAEYEARLSYHWYPKHHSAIYSEKFADEVEKATDGKIKIERYDSGQLFGIREALTAVSSGSVQMAGVLDLNLAAVDSNFAIGTMPFFFPDYEKRRAFFNETPEGRAVKEGIEKKLGIKLLCYNPVGPTTFFSTKPMEGTIEELEGRKIRYLSEAEKPMYQELGMNTVSVSTSEMYTALKQGMIDTCSTVPSAVKAYSWWDFFEYCTYPYKTYVDTWVVVNAKWWESLPADMRKTIEEDVAPRVGKEATESVVEYSDECIKEFLEEHDGQIAYYYESEIEEFRKFYRENVWPKMAEGRLDPEFWQAAKEYMGYE